MGVSFTGILTLTLRRRRESWRILSDPRQQSATGLWQSLSVFIKGWRTSKVVARFLPPVVVVRSASRHVHQKRENGFCRVNRDEGTGRPVRRRFYRPHLSSNGTCFEPSYPGDRDGTISGMFQGMDWRQRQVDPKDCSGTCSRLLALVGLRTFYDIWIMSSKVLTWWNDCRDSVWPVCLASAHSY